MKEYRQTNFCNPSKYWNLTFISKHSVILFLILFSPVQEFVANNFYSLMCDSASMCYLMCWLFNVVSLHVCRFEVCAYFPIVYFSSRCMEEPSKDLMSSLSSLKILSWLLTYLLLSYSAENAYRKFILSTLNMYQLWPIVQFCIMGQMLFLLYCYMK